MAVRFRWKRELTLIVSLAFLLFSRPSAFSFTVQEQREIGEKLFLRLKGELEFVNDPLLVAYIREVGQRVVKASGDSRFRYRFFLVKGNQPNAFTIPGGYVFVNTALLGLIGSEEELAVVLAHELAHNVLDHISRVFEQVKRVSLATVALTVAALLLAKSPEAKKAAATMGSAMAESLMLKYSRENEFEADQLALRILQRANYNPYGKVEFLKKIQKWSKTISAELPVYLSTHPALEDRISYLEAQMSNGRNRISPSRSFNMLKARLFLWQRGPQRTLAELELKGEKSLEDLYLLALVYLLQGRLEEARTVLEKAHRVEPFNPFVTRELGMCLFKLNRLKEAEPLIEEAMDHFPYDPELALARTNLLLSEGKKEEALSFCHWAVERFPDEAFFYKLLGQLYMEGGRHALAYEAFGLASLTEGDKKTALYHLQRALELSQGADRERIEAKLKEIKAN